MAAKKAESKAEPKAAEPIAPVFNNEVVAADQVEGPKVRMHLPRPVLLTVHHGYQVSFPAGLQDVPAEYADHPYLAAHGAKKVKDTSKAAKSDSKGDDDAADDGKDDKKEKPEEADAK